MVEGYEITIGLEVHAQMATESKVFCSCSTQFGAEPNTQTCPVCLGMPGALPVLNKRAVELIVKAGMALNCEIAPFSRFDRKNYFYPDLPTGYQITQYELPICHQGFLDVDLPEGDSFQVGIERIHLEEDAGKLVHGSGDSITEAGDALIDFNRAGVPLMEIVSQPDMATPAQAKAYLMTLKSILEYLGVSDCNMEEGSFRADANISVRPVGAKELGTKIELKNMNSFRAIERALEYECRRQSEILEQGGEIEHQTRTWDEKNCQTVLMRNKEYVLDYRYFPETDLIPVQVGEEWLEEIRSSIGELPREKRERLIREYGLPEYDARILTQEKELADLFEVAAGKYDDAKAVANWVMGELLRLVNEENLCYDELRIRGEQLAEMLQLQDDGVISGKIAKCVFEEMFQTGKDPRQIVEEQGLEQISDEERLAKIVREVLEANPQAVADYRDGKDRAVKFLVGQVMKVTRGRANPPMVNELLVGELQAGE